MAAKRAYSVSILMRILRRPPTPRHAWEEAQMVRGEFAWENFYDFALRSLLSLTAVRRDRKSKCATNIFFEIFIIPTRRRLRYKCGDDVGERKLSITLYNINLIFFSIFYIWCTLQDDETPPPSTSTDADLNNHHSRSSYHQSRTGKEHENNQNNINTILRRTSE